MEKVSCGLSQIFHTMAEVGCHLKTNSLTVFNWVSDIVDVFVNCTKKKLEIVSDVKLVSLIYLFIFILTSSFTI